MAKTIGTELRRLLKKLGGTPSKYDQTNELIHKITDQVESGGGGGALIVEVDGDPVSGFSLTKTAGEIISALPLVFVKVPAEVGEGEDYTMIPGYQETDDGYAFSVSGASFSAPTLDDYPHKGGVS